jgi:hypothetical protein
MMDTPRTDAAAVGFARLLVDSETAQITEIVPSHFARQLEREVLLLRELVLWNATGDWHKREYLERRILEIEQQAKKVECK